MLIGALGLAIFFLLLTLPILGLIKMFFNKSFFFWNNYRCTLGDFFYAIKISTISITLSMMSAGALITAFIDPIYNRKKYHL